MWVCMGGVGKFRLYQRSLAGVSGRSRLSDYIVRVPRILVPPAEHEIDSRLSVCVTTDVTRYVRRTPFCCFVGDTNPSDRLSGSSGSLSLQR